MYTIIIIFPIVSSIFVGILGRKIGSTGAQIITTSSVIISAIISYILFYEICLCNDIVHITLGNWVSIGIFNVNWALLFDSLTISILIVVLTISSLVHIFSIDYISIDPHTQRFFSYLSIFTGFILILVSADNYILLFVGWEGIGISSYLLIGFWYTRIEAIKSAIKALIINRIGDLSYTISISIIFATIGNFDIITIINISPIINTNIIIIIGILIVIAAIGKSAQIGLHTWLPDAMAGPTPVSALIHAATLVTAGVYLIIRNSAIIEYSNTIQIFIIFIGTTTTFFAATTGIVQNDIKTIIAYSTCSQIAYIFISCGLSQYHVALFHLINHAFFKAILFISAGAIIHSSIDIQDSRKIGSIIAFLPFTYCSILIASISLIAIPFITGYYSKDIILEFAYSQYNINSFFVYIIATITAGITAFYSVRLLTIVFISIPNGNKIIYNNIHESNILVIIPIVVLYIFAVFFGYYTSDIYIGIGSNIIDNAIIIHPNNIIQIDAEFSLSTIIKLIPFIITIIGTIFALWIYQYDYNGINRIVDNKIFRNIYTYFINKWNFDTLFNYYISYSILNISYNISKVIDKGIIEIIGPYGITQSIYNSSITLSKLDTKNLTDYTLYVGTSIVFISTIYAIIITGIINIDNNIVLIISLILIIYNVNNNR